jgi:hypothetical protein
MKLWTFLLLSLFLSPLIEAKNRARTILVRGKILYKNKNQKTTRLKRGNRLPLGTTLQSFNKAFAKIVFDDNSSINIGPHTKIILSGNVKKGENIISLLKGELRSRLNKTPGKHKQRKFYIKTPTAVMGVRGTDFISEYSPKTKETNLKVIRGKVAFGPLPRLKKFRLNSRSIENILQGPRSIRVKRGFASKIFKKGRRPSLPKKIPAKMLKRLIKNVNSLSPRKIKKRLQKKIKKKKKAFSQKLKKRPLKGKKKLKLKKKPQIKKLLKKRFGF